MNSLRAWSSRASRCCISLRVAASWPTSSVPSSGIGVEKSPSATFCAAASSRPSRFACARAASQPAASAAARAIAPAIRICRLIRATVSSTSSSGVDRTATQRGLPRAGAAPRSRPCAGRRSRRRRSPPGRWLPPRRRPGLGRARSALGPRGRQVRAGAPRPRVHASTVTADRSAGDARRGAKLRRDESPRAATARRPRPTRPARAAPASRRSGWSEAAAPRTGRRTRSPPR